ncbi:MULTISPECIES: geranylgeranyl reductase family protein [Thermodesulfovibrio]|jgi:geranylgeranyl reductase|uniref:geranylgeranyl reductase family protein n=1 Tax=Thermodesulfovibrio TaxID=28261 RepID=UPI002606852D|nr:geranylgeranyl reductase family protein [Thermodesulfovibrio sp.]
MNVDVLVVGGGPAGASAARFLSVKGIRTALVEKNFSFHKPCGGGIPSAGLKELGLLEDIEKSISFNRIKKIKIVPPFSSPIEVDFVGGEILIFNRADFDNFLRQKAKDSGAEVIEAELLDIRQLKDSFASTVKNKNGENFKIISKYIIAADGVNSRVCSLLAMEKPDFYWTVSLQLPEILISQRDTVEFWFGSSHASYFYSWVFPGRGYLSVGTGSENIRKVSLLIENFIQKRFSVSFQEIKNNCSVRLRAYRIPRWKKREFFKDRILFCGDAMGFTMPVSFEGIYYAMKSGQFAAEAIGKDNPEIYAKLWNKRFLREFNIMKNFQDRMFGDDRKIDEWLNLHRDREIQQLAMALWLRKEHGRQLLPLYLKAFQKFLLRLSLSKLKSVRGEV